MDRNWLGLDIGGANIKFDDTRGNHGQIPFEIWKDPQSLTTTLENRVTGWNEYQRLAVTMTGELADCFTDKRQGVTHICESVRTASPHSKVLFYQTSGRFVSFTEAKDNWILTAASNWHALASWIGQHVGDCLVIDIGSTTTDIIPVRGGRPAARGNTDWQRLQSQELLYTGVIRSPLSAVAPRIKLDHRPINLAQENFATMLDVYLVLERIVEPDPGLRTADGRAADIPSAFRRLAKMICCDLTEVSRDVLVQMAIQAAERHAELIGSAIESVNRRHGGADRFVVCGEGAWLAKEILNSIFDRPKIFNQHTGQLSDISAGFSTAGAVARLAQQHAAFST